MSRRAVGGARRARLHGDGTRRDAARVTATIAALAWLACAASACVRPPRAARPATAAEAQALIGTLAARERATRGLRVSMSVRVSGGGAPSLLSSPAYLAVDADGALRLQVLSPFGMTVLDLAVDHGAYVLTLPLRNETKRGTVDPAALTAGADDASGDGSGDRMIVALALLFTPKAGPDCRVHDTRDLTCPVAAGVSADVTVDDERRPVRERYAAGGRELFTATFADWSTPEALVPGRLEIADVASGARMTAKITKARTAAAPTAAAAR